MKIEVEEIRKGFRKQEAEDFLSYGVRVTLLSEGLFSHIAELEDRIENALQEYSSTQRTEKNRTERMAAALHAESPCGMADEIVDDMYDEIRELKIENAKLRLENKAMQEI